MPASTTKRATITLLTIVVIGGMVSAARIGAAKRGGHDLVVINDLNVFDQVAAQDSNNVRLYGNLVNFTGAPAAMKRVVVHTGHGYNCASGTCMAPPAPPKFETVMQMGSTYTVIEANDASLPLTTIPSDVKVLMLWLPSVEYSAAEVAAFKQLIAAGGRVVVVGERGSTPELPESYLAHRQTLNKLLADMGTTMRNIGGEYECPSEANAHIALPKQSIKNHQVTDDVKGLTVACLSELEIGPKEKELVRSTRPGRHVLAAVREWR